MKLDELAEEQSLDHYNKVPEKERKVMDDGRIPVQRIGGHKLITGACEL